MKVVFLFLQGPNGGYLTQNGRLMTAPEHDYTVGGCTYFRVTLIGLALRAILFAMDNHAYSTWLEIDLGAIKKNIRTIQSLTGTSVMAVVKANGYGHGFQAAAKAAMDAGATWCGVARIEEAINLRAVGITTHIMVLGYSSPVLIPEAIEHDIHVAIYDPKLVDEYETNAKRIGKKLKAHLKVETGMGRLGMAPEKVADFLDECRHHPLVEIDGIFTHLACADEPESDLTHRQLSVFDRLLTQLKAAGLCPEVAHAANSAGVFNFPEAHYDLVRPGISIYGMRPSPDTILPDSFHPALTWKARLTSVRQLPPGHAVSYGAEYITSKDERIGVIPVGYGDGFRRVRGQQVLVHGKRVDVVGRVCMDQCMLHLDSVPEAVLGDEVILLGEQGGERISAGDLAMRWETINYEVVCGLADRLPRVYINA